MEPVRPMVVATIKAPARKGEGRLAKVCAALTFR
jgi:hypothetical protein